MNHSSNKDDLIEQIDLNTITATEFDRRCHSFIVNAAHSKGLDFTECELVCDDILMKIFVHHNFGCFRYSQGSFKAYLAQTARNMAINYLRKQWRIDYHAPETLEVVCDAKMKDDRAEDLAQNMENSQLLNEAINILRSRLRNPIQAEALVLNAIEEKPVSEVARLLDMTPQQVSLACCRCRKLLKGIIIELKKRQES